MDGQMSRRLVAKVAIFVLLCVPMITFVVAITISEIVIDPDLSIVWLLTSLTLLAASAAMYFVIVSEMDLAVDIIKNMNDEILKDVIGVLHKELQFTTIPLPDKNTLRIEAAKLYSSVLANDNPSSRRIWYFGGASLQPSSIEMRDLQNKADDDPTVDIQNDPAMQVRMNFEKITEPGSNIVFERHIHLPRPC